MPLLSVVSICLQSQPGNESAAHSCPFLPRLNGVSALPACFLPFPSALLGCSANPLAIWLSAILPFNCHNTPSVAGSLLDFPINLVHPHPTNSFHPSTPCFFCFCQHNMKYRALYWDWLLCPFGSSSVSGACRRVCAFLPSVRCLPAHLLLIATCAHHRRPSVESLLCRGHWLV